MLHPLTSQTQTQCVSHVVLQQTAALQSCRDPQHHNNRGTTPPSGLTRHLQPDALLSFRTLTAADMMSNIHMFFVVCIFLVFCFPTLILAVTHANTRSSRFDTPSSITLLTNTWTKRDRRGSRKMSDGDIGKALNHVK